MTIRTVEPRCVDPAHRSYSGDTDWDECQFAWQAKNILKTPWPYPPVVAIGSAVDWVVKQWLLDRPVDIERTLRGYFTEYNTPDIGFDESLEKMVRLLALWQDEVRPVWEKVGIYAVEYELHFEVEGVPYHVHIDAILDDGTIIDLKTSDKRLGQDRAMYDIQLTTYAAGVYEVFDHLAPQVILDGLISSTMPEDVAKARGIRPKDRPKPWHDRQVSNRTLEQIKSWRDGVVRREQSRTYAEFTGVYQTQGRSSPFACNGCPAKPICPEWRGWEGMFGDMKEVTDAEA